MKCLAMFSMSPKISSMEGLRLTMPWKTYFFSSFFSSWNVSLRRVLFSEILLQDFSDRRGLEGHGDVVRGSLVDPAEDGLRIEPLAHDDDVDQGIEMFQLLQKDGRRPGGLRPSRRGRS